MKTLIALVLLSLPAFAQDLITCSSTVCTSPLPLSVPSLSLTGGTAPSGSPSNLYLWQYNSSTGSIVLFPFQPTNPTSYVITIPRLAVTYGATVFVSVSAAGAVPGSATTAATPCSVQANTPQSPLVLLSCQITSPGVVAVYGVNLRSKVIPSFPATLVVYLPTAQGTSITVGP
jgi:hypothetical protein